VNQVPTPQITCLIDGKPGINTSYPVGLLYGAENLEEETHKVRIGFMDPINSSALNVSVSSVQYTPSLSHVPAKNEVTVVDACDRFISFSNVDDWTIFKSKNQTS
jgi:hypothetical protein